MGKGGQPATRLCAPVFRFRSAGGRPGGHGEGGQYNSGAFPLTKPGAILDPIKNTWSTLTPPSFWPFIGDSASAVLPNGKFLVGDKLLTQDALLRSGNPDLDHVGIGG